MELSTIVLILHIQLLAETSDPLTFGIPAVPETLKIKTGSFGQGYEIDIMDNSGNIRQWYAHKILGLWFEEMEDDEAARLSRIIEEFSPA